MAIVGAGPVALKPVILMEREEYDLLLKQHNELVAKCEELLVVATEDRETLIELLNEIVAWAPAYRLFFREGDTTGLATSSRRVMIKVKPLLEKYDIKIKEEKEY